MSNGLQDTGASPKLGQETMANSAPVVIASDQSPIPVTGSITATNPSVGVNGAADPGSSTQVGGSDGANLQPAHMYPAGGAGEFAIGVELRNAAGEAGTPANPIAITGAISATNPSVGVNGAPIPASSTQIGGEDDVGNLQPAHIKPAGTAAVVGDPAIVVAISPNNTVAITAAALPLPAGASTSALQTAGNASLASIDADIDVPLSTRAAAATQTDGTQRTRVTDGVTDAAVKAGGAPAVVGDPALVVAISPNNTLPISGTVTANQGTPAVVAAPWPVRLSDGAAFYDSTKTGQLPAALVGGRLDENVGAWLGSTAPTVGSKTSANSVPVVIASDQGALPVTPAPVGDTVGVAGVLGALNATALVALAGQHSVGVFIAAGTLVGTVVPEVSYDGGATWVAVEFLVPSTSARSASLIFAVANPATSRSIAVSGGQTHARVRVSAFTGGAATAQLRATSVEDAVSAAPIGTARTSKILQSTSTLTAAVETLVSLAMISNGVTGAPATTYNVTAGKTLRLTGFLLTWRAAAAAKNGVTIRLRFVPAGLVVLASPVIATLFVEAVLAGVGEGGATSFVFFDGFELPSGFGVGMSQLATVGGASGFDVQLIGYEY